MADTTKANEAFIWMTIWPRLEYIGLEDIELEDIELEGDAFQVVPRLQVFGPEGEVREAAPLLRGPHQQMARAGPVERRRVALGAGRGVRGGGELQGVRVGQGDGPNPMTMCTQLEDIEGPNLMTMLAPVFKQRIGDALEVLLGPVASVLQKVERKQREGLLALEEMKLALWRKKIQRLKRRRACRFRRTSSLKASQPRTRHCHRPKFLPAM